MGHLMKLVTTAMEWSYEAGETEVSAETLQAAAELFTLGRDTIRLIDGAGPTVEIPRSDTTEQKGVQEAGAGEASAKDAPKQRASHHDAVESTVEVVQCPTCGSVSKAKLKGQPVVITPHPPRKALPVRNVTRWMEQGTEWTLVQKKE
jgi:hypothetical protein